MFIHLIDESGDIVRQHDAIHCNCDCPTSQWEIGQSVIDEATVSLVGLSSGEYRLAVGMYDESTGERSQARDSSGKIIPDTYYLLEDTMVVGHRL